MKPLHKIDLIFSVNGKTVAIQPIHDWTVPEIVDQLKVIREQHPDWDYRIKPRRVLQS